MITQKEVWDRLSQEEQYLQLTRTEDVRDIFPPGVSHHTSPSEWGRMTPVERFARLHDVELDLANRQRHTLDTLVADSPAPAREGVAA